MQKIMGLTLFATLLLTFLATESLEAYPELLPETLFSDAANPVFTTSAGVFQPGKSTPTSDDVKPNGSCSSPKPLLIIRPKESGTYPVIMFHHGTFLHNDMYTDLLRFISSHGYIIVAPQYYELMPPSAYEELETAAAVANWLSTNLQCVLPEHIEGNLEKLALGGHSRGGYIAFALALGHAKTSLKVKFSALLGIGPVAGTSIEHQLEPRILNYAPSSMNLAAPAAIIGSGLGNQSVFPFGPTCAPNGVNHWEFFNECRPPCAHFVTTDYGHMDILNDYINPIGTFARLACKGCNWPFVSRNPVRRSVGGVVVAFLKAYLEGESQDYLAILKNRSLSPAKLNPVQIKELSLSIAQV